MFFVPDAVRLVGLEMVGISVKSNEQRNEKLFHSQYGSSSTVVADIWFSIQKSTDEQVRLTREEKTEKGLEKYLVATWWLWTYPKNASITAAHFSICEKYCRGKDLWRWVFRISALVGQRVSWDPTLDDPNCEVFIVSVDGTDFKIWEPKHPDFPVDRGYYSHKYNHAGLRYEVAISVFSAKVVWINGPFRAGKTDIEIFGEGRDAPKVHNFKSRARLRQETFNGRLKNFAALRDTFRHGIQNHMVVFESITVFVTSQMEHGSPLFAV